MAKESKGLTRAREIYQDRSRRVKEIKAEGKMVMGYLSMYPVLEILTALDIIPYSIFGDMREPITKADACLPTAVCPFIRSCLDLGLKGRYDFLDGVVMSHVCDVSEKTAHIWRIYLEPPYYHFIDTPHTARKAAQKQHKEQLKDFKKTLESFTGKKLSIESLKEAINSYNELRALVRELYDLRKPDPPLISGGETLQVIMASMSIPVKEASELLRQVISEVQKRKDGPKKKPARLLVWGSVIDNTAFIDMIEGLEANLVMDDTDAGSRVYFSDVKLTKDPLDGLAYRYLVELKSPRTYKEAPITGTKKDYMADLEYRFGYIRDYIKDWNVNGVILESLRYCDVHGYDVPGLKDYLDHLGVPNIYLEHDYSESALAPLKTRVQAFLEIVS